MHVIEGVSMTDACYDAYNRALQGEAVDAEVYAVDVPQADGCTNCNGNGHLLLQVVVDGPYDYYEKGRSCLGYDAEGKGGAWWRVRRTFYPCPMCIQGDQGEAPMVAALLSDSGLQHAEREWKLGFYRGRGKDNALQVVAPYGAQPTPAGMLFLYGDYGVGKSGMMKAMVAGFCRDGHKARYVRAADIVLEAQASFDSRGGAERVRHKYERYQVLAVDEIDRVSFNEWTQSFLFGLLDARYNMRAGRATMVASNKALEQVPEYGYLASRMEDGLRVRVAGDKLRGGGNG